MRNSSFSSLTISSPRSHDSSTTCTDGQLPKRRTGAGGSLSPLRGRREQQARRIRELKNKASQQQSGGGTTPVSLFKNRSNDDSCNGINSKNITLPPRSPRKRRQNKAPQDSIHCIRYEHRGDGSNNGDPSSVSDEGGEKDRTDDILNSLFVFPESNIRFSPGPRNNKHSGVGVVTIGLAVKDELKMDSMDSFSSMLESSRNSNLFLDDSDDSSSGEDE